MRRKMPAAGVGSCRLVGTVLVFPRRRLNLQATGATRAAIATSSAHPPHPSLNLSPSTALRIAALLGFLAVALGAFGAHALKESLARSGLTPVWEKAVLYHLAHAVVLLLLASRPPLPAVAWALFFAGIVIFSGSLYVLAFTGIRWLGAVTPIGGLCLLGGWLALALGVWKSPP